MRGAWILGAIALGGCGIENLFVNAGHEQYDRPASIIRGTVTFVNPGPLSVAVLGGGGELLEPFQTAAETTTYEARLPSSSYTMLRLQARSGDGVLRAIVPAIGEESVAADVNLDARAITETLIAEAGVSARGQSFAQITPSAYVGDGTSTGARSLIRRDLEVPGPTQTLLQMVERILAKLDPMSGATDPYAFRVPELDEMFVVTFSPIENGWLARTRFDYTGDGVQDLTSEPFDAVLAEAARLYQPAGCPDPANIRLVFTVDFNDGALDGVCRPVGRSWITDKPGKSMYFVGWVHEESELQDPAINTLLGAGVPNQIPMYDDGTNGDEAASDGIWTVTFVVPIDPARKLRVGYKFTWGTRGANWTGSEEWPGNSRILQVEDVNGDAIVYRRDVFGDEATNKDRANLNPSSGGVVDWDKALLKSGVNCGPEAREQRFVPGTACQCAEEWFTPTAVGPVRVACTQ
jgi:hypothetical protein